MIDFNSKKFQTIFLVVMIPILVTCLYFILFTSPSIKKIMIYDKSGKIMVQETARIGFIDRYDDRITFSIYGEHGRKIGQRHYKNCGNMTIDKQQ